MRFLVLLGREKFGLVDGANFLIDSRGEPVFGDFEIAGGLKIRPVTRAGVEIARKSQGGIGRDAPPFVNSAAAAKGADHIRMV